MHVIRWQTNKVQAGSIVRITTWPLALWLLLGLALPTSAKPLWQQDWIEVRSPHFVVVSALPQARTTRLVVELENFRTAAVLVTNIGRFEERIPTHVYLLPYAVAELGFDGTYVGYFVSGMRANYAAVVPSREKLPEVLKHEYVHFLVHNQDQLIYPTWFDEGFAELLATMTINDKMIEYGKAPSNRIDALSYGQWLPFEQLLQARGIDQLNSLQKAMFYAQSWFLVHYLIFARPETDFSAQNREFLRLSESGVAPVAAFEQAFELKVSRLEALLRVYARQAPNFRRPLPQPIAIAPTTTVAVAADRVAAELGLLALTLRRHDEARRFYEGALALNPRNAAALVGMGDVLKHGNQAAEADPYYRQAIALEPSNPLHELDYAEYLVSLAADETEPARARDLFSAARRHFARSLALDPNNPETLAQQGLSYLLAGDAPDKAVQSLEAARALLPAQAEIRLQLARAYAANDQPDKARRHVRSLMAWADAKNTNELQKLLDALQTVAARPSNESTANDNAKAPGTPVSK